VSNLNYANTPTPTPGNTWLQSTDQERFSRVKNALIAKMPRAVEVVKITAAKQDGQIVAKLLKPLTAAERGTLLLDVEALLKAAIDPALVIWLEALGDRNSLRNLRGIKVEQ
jgi:hypothetical protein